MSGSSSPRPAAGFYRASTCGSALDTALSILNACGGTEIACNDDACGLQSRADFNATSGQEVWIRVGGFQALVGTGSITVSSIPVPWIEDGDAGDLPDTAQVPSGTGNLGAITGNLDPSDADMYRIQVCDYANFSATTACVADVDDGTGTGTPDGGVTIDDLLYYLAIFEAGVIAPTSTTAPAPARPTAASPSTTSSTTSSASRPAAKPKLATPAPQQADSRNTRAHHVPAPPHAHETPHTHAPIAAVAIVIRTNAPSVCESSTITPMRRVSRYPSTTHCARRRDRRRVRHARLAQNVQISVQVQRPGSKHHAAHRHTHRRASCPPSRRTPA
jgi:hypothetical protein